jgi:thioredoxin 1
MSEQVKTLTDDDFQGAIQSGVALVDFWAPWCGPCQQQGPIVEAVAGKVSGKATVAKLNVDENPKTAQDFGVMSIPTLVLFKDGAEVNRFVGLQTEDALVGAIESAAQ